MTNIQQHVLKWYKKQGRKHLPWQKNRTPYRVWISEIMLQQTQVDTVIPYFHRFITRFPSIKKLSSASIDEVLHYWSGLGYYSRARNLHKTAKMIHTTYHGIFPDSLSTLQQLPGIGRSTAGAILSFGMQKRAAILDGNIKRLFARVYTICSPLSDAQALKILWALAEKNLPLKHIEKYNQALMDLGALVCTRLKPKCLTCPLPSLCLSYQSGRTTDIPVKKLTRQLAEHVVYLLIFRDQHGRLFLEKRPPIGIWGGLWCFPSCHHENQISSCCRNHGFSKYTEEKLPDFYHTFSHCRWHIFPRILNVKRSHHTLFDLSHFLWIKADKVPRIGLPKPIKNLLAILHPSKINSTCGS